MAPGLTRFSAGAGVEVIEVTEQRAPTARGKTDPADAEAAARAVLAGEATATPKQRVGIVESIRLLRVARRRVKSRTQVEIQIKRHRGRRPRRPARRAAAVSKPSSSSTRWRTSRPGAGRDPPRPGGRCAPRPPPPSSSTRAAARAETSDDSSRSPHPAARSAQRRPRDRRQAAQRSPATTRIGCAPQRPRRALRRLAGRSLERQDHPPSPQPGRRPPSQQRALHDRVVRMRTTPRPRPMSSAAPKKARPAARSAAASCATSPAASTPSSSQTSTTPRPSRS